MEPGKSPKMRLLLRLLTPLEQSDQNKLKPRRSWFPFMNNTSPCLGTVGSQEVHIQKPNCMSLPENHNFCKQKMLLS